MPALLRKTAIPVFLGTLFLVGCDFEDWDGGLAAHARFEKTVALDPKGTFSLENVNGKVAVEAWDQNQVQIEADKAAASDSMLDQIKIEVRGEGSRVDVITRMPRGGIFSGGRGRVEYHVRVPAKARVELHTVNGGVQVDGVSGPVRAQTVNGGVKISEAAAELNASTVNGSIEARYRSIAGEGHHGFSTTNGSVTLYLPPDAEWEFEASTVNGGISTEFPLEVSGKIGGRHLKGRIGQGGGSFNVHTVNGAVKLLKSGEAVVRLRGSEMPVRPES